jgi:hypothetical protein
MNTKLLAIAALVAGLSGGAIADDKMTTDEAPNAPASTFKTLDADRDGYIEPQEASANVQLNQNFKEVDSNSDNRISEREFVAATTGSRGSKPDMMDRTPGSGVDSGTYRGD